MISGSTLGVIILIVVIAGVLFLAPIAIPSWVKTIFGIVLGIILLVVLLNLIGVVAF
jgi:hypothetical protein